MMRRVTILDELSLVDRGAVQEFWSAVVSVVLGLLVIWLGLVLVLLLYLAMPIDLVPDFIPLVGYADDGIVITLALRSVVRNSGTEALERHWPGTPEGLRIVWRLAGIPAKRGPRS